MQPIRLAIDVQSGDWGSKTIINGVLEGQKKSKIPLILTFCGKEKVIREIIDLYGARKILDKEQIIIEHCEQEITRADKPTRVWKTKKNTSIIRCINLQREGKVDGSLTAGDTRILTSASLFLLGRHPGVGRPALAAFLPTIAKRPTLVLDVGANLNCRVEHLVSFGLMGYKYCKEFYSLENPSVALLNVGKESSKGTKVIIDAGKILAEKCPGYCGFIEGARVLSGDADVIVCDGFAGNVLLKVCESFHALTESVLDGHDILIKALRSKMAILNAENYGAVPLLGIKGIVMKAHGSSTSRAIMHALLLAVEAIQKRCFAPYTSQ